MPAESAAESRVDNESAEWVDERHVERREAADGFDVDRRVEDVARLTMSEGQRQEAMNGRIADLAEGLIMQDIEHSKPAGASPWLNLGLQTIRFGQSMDIRGARRVMTLVIPSEHAAKPPPQRKQRSNRDVRRRPPVAKYKSTQVAMVRPGPPSGSAIAHTSCSGTSLRSAWQRRSSVLEIRRINARRWHHCTVSMIRSCPNHASASCSSGTALVRRRRRRQMPQLVRIAHHVQRPNHVALNLERRSLHRSLGSVHDDTGQAVDGRKAQREVVAPPRTWAFARDVNQEPRRRDRRRRSRSAPPPPCRRRPSRRARRSRAAASVH